MDIRIKFGKRVKHLRIEKGISQEKLAELSDLHRTYISSVELGARNISLVNIERLASALDCSVEELMNFSTID